MALSAFSPSSIASSSSCSFSASPAFYFLLQPQIRSSYVSKGLRFRISCSNHTIQFESKQPERIEVHFEATKKKRKPRPSFLEQINEKWSMKITSSREKFPWQEERLEQDRGEKESERASEVNLMKTEVNADDSASDLVSVIPSLTRSISAPWAHGSKSGKPQAETEGVSGEEFDMSNTNSLTSVTSVVEMVKDFEKPKREATKILRKERKIDSATVDREERIDSGEKENRWRRSNTELAEKMLPEHELRRLRNIALRMLERTKVGIAGITQDLVNNIHKKWKTDEVVKLKFEGPLTFNMKRTHEILESKTGGLVIWRSGSSIVLYRGLTYNLPCVQSYTDRNLTNDADEVNESKDITSEVPIDVRVGYMVEATTSSTSFTLKYPKNLSEEELVDLSDLNHMLDELGPRFKDWSGCEPLPVDADLLPSIVPGYKPPFRLLPYGVRHCLRDKEMTMFRRLARTAPPHFALGRNRELQGLAKAIVKLWEKSAIAKIAIKRGVENTSNDRMAEELKRLTGGTLLSRNKEFIVIYRGNDFLPPKVTEELKGRKNLRDLSQDEEEKARQLAKASIESNSKASKGCTLIAGTLAETVAATSRWGSLPDDEDIANMRRDSDLLRHATLIRLLEKKLALAKGKFKQADKALAKVQEKLEPADLPTDLETISDSERFLFRKMGLSMKPFLHLGRRGVFDGTIENMHLHWKFRELVKIIVRGKTLPQVKHIAISLEAESGGVLVSLDKTTKGYAIIIYRGKNYSRPEALRPKNLLSKRQALARSVELQRREALKHHIVDMEEKIELLKSQLEERKNGKIFDEGSSPNMRWNDFDLFDDDSEEVITN